MNGKNHQFVQGQAKIKPTSLTSNLPVAAQESEKKVLYIQSDKAIAGRKAGGRNRISSGWK
jgi:hypothetical protein